jgi:two-component system C4-dicarboxylate transport sensor histidine kinase DctB
MAACCCLLLGALTYRLSFDYSLGHERQLAQQRLDGLALSLEATLARHESLPTLLGLDPSLRALLHEPRSPARIAAANAYLEAAQQGAAVAAAYLIANDGETLAASNWRLSRSFVGQNYAFRPYFRDALEKGLGRFYGVGATTGEPGYFIAAAVREQGRALGVVVLKISLGELEQALTNVGDTLLLADADGVVFLAADHRLRYRTLAPLSAAVTARIAASKQYGEHPLPPLATRPLPTATSEPLRLALIGEAEHERLLQARPVGGLGWQLIQLSAVTEVRATALAVATAVGFAAAFLLGLAAYFRLRRQRLEERRRLYAELETRIAERTADLTDKIAALERTEAILRETRDAAVQAGKLATLGQMAVGISHELNQPLAALHSFADNARAFLARGQTEAVADNLATISELVERAGRIVGQLKSFARKEAATPTAVSVAAAIDHALTIVEPRRRELAAQIVVAPLPPGLQVLAEAGRLEQVLVNLLRNGLDAMQGQPSPVLEISAVAEAGSGSVTLRVRDHGPGLAPEVLGHLFEPFYTTKPVGEGLGLGLAISLTIVESYGGSLTASNLAAGGAEFALTLPAAALDRS